MTGTEWLIDVAGCPADALRNPRRLRTVCERIVADLGLHVVGEPLWHQFPEPGGVTGLYLLSESHLTCHTFPEFGTATFNLYCCRPRPEWGWNEGLAAELGAVTVRVRKASRGIDVESPALVAATGEDA